MDFARPNLTLVIDRTLYRPDESGREPLSLVEAAIEGGITMLQFRIPSDTEGTGEDLAADAIAHHLREISAGRVPFLVTTDLKLADRCRADEVLLVGDRIYKPSDAKKYLTPAGDALVGCYADSVPTAARAERGGADFVQVASMFDETADEPFQLLRKVKDAIHLPLVVFGGIDTPDRAADAVQAGADGIAVTTAILGASDPRAAAQALRAAMSA